MEADGLLSLAIAGEAMEGDVTDDDIDDEGRKTSRSIGGETTLFGRADFQLGLGSPLTALASLILASH